MFGMVLRAKNNFYLICLRLLQLTDKLKLEKYARIVDTCNTKMDGSPKMEVLNKYIYIRDEELCVVIVTFVKPLILSFYLPTVLHNGFPLSTFPHRWNSALFCTRFILIDIRVLLSCHVTAEIIRSAALRPICGSGISVILIC